jgi:hypothetical protein
MLRRPIGVHVEMSLYELLAEEALKKRVKISVVIRDHLWNAYPDADPNLRKDRWKQLEFCLEGSESYVGTQKKK